jgi:hypothetical protein
MSDQFWGTIKHLGKTFAVVGPEGAVERARKALGSVVAIEPNAAAAPLPVAPLAPVAAGVADATKPADAPPSAMPDKDVGKEAFDRASSGRFGTFNDKEPDDPKEKRKFGAKRDATKWAMVRAPQQPPA